MNYYYVDVVAVMLLCLSEIGQLLFTGVAGRIPEIYYGYGSVEIGKLNAFDFFTVVIVSACRIALREREPKRRIDARNFSSLFFF